MNTVSVNTTTQDIWSSNSDYAALREKVFTFLQASSSSQWTDYNYHDPGVTILEQYCFALTDLAYRTGFTMADLLQNKDGTTEDVFPGSLRLLNSFPVVRNDIRKVILDSLTYGNQSISDKIYNAWVTEHSSKKSQANKDTTSAIARNLYSVEIQLTTKDYNELLNDKGEFAESKKKELESKIAHCLGAYRNICTDYGQVKLLYKDEITVTGQVNIKNGYAAEKVLASIYAQIDEFINPHVPFYTLSEMTAKGIPVDKVYEGPSLSRGFILDDDLKLRLTEIDVSDIGNIIFRTEGVSMASNIRVNGQANRYQIGAQLSKTGDCFALLKTGLMQGEVVDLSKNGAKIALESLNKLQYNTFLAEFNLRRAKPSAGKVQQQNFKQQGSFREPGKYFSIQKYFPAIYGIGDYGLPASVFVNEPEAGLSRSSTARQAQAKQLKAYLVLFEQLLANYLAQLANVGKLLSIKSTDNGQPIKAGSDIQTYFGQPVIDQTYDPQSFNVPNGGDILLNFAEYVTSLGVIAEDTATRIARKGAILDHLLARVNEKIDSYPYRLYGDLYHADAYSDDGSNMDNSAEKASIAKDLTVLNKKTEYLENYDAIGYDRSRGFNYYQKPPDLTYVSGLEQKMAFLLGLDIIGQRELHKITDLKIEDAAPQQKKQKEQLIDIDIKLTEEIITEAIIIDYSIDEEIIIKESDEKKNDNLGFHFNNIDSTGINAFFRNGMTLSNYRIARHKNKGNGHEYFITIFNISSDPDKQKWLKIHTHSKREVAKQKQQKLLKLATDMNRRSEGFHLVEHVLLRDMRNPYKLSIILPLWPARFQDNGFQQYVQQLFAKHAPLYAVLNFIWLDLVYMKEFEQYYFAWLDALRQGSAKTNNPEAEKLKTFIKTYSKHPKKVESS